MKKQILLVVIGFLIIFALSAVGWWFYPNMVYFQAKSIDQLTQRNSTESNKKINPKMNDQMTDVSDSEFVGENQQQALFDLLNNFPFSQHNTKAIVAANPRPVQDYIHKVSSYIDRNIINNSKIPSNRKAQILWDMFKSYPWVGDDNVFRALIKDKLMYLNNPTISHDIANTYSALISSGTDSISYRHDLIEIANSVSQQPDRATYAAWTAALSQEMRSSLTREDAQGLGSFAIQSYFKYAKPSDVSGFIPQVILMSDQNPRIGLAYMDTLVKSTLKAAESADHLSTIYNTQMTEGTRKDLNKALAFNLHEDGSLVLSDFPIQTLQELQSYFDTQQSQNIPDPQQWQSAKERISQQLSEKQARAPNLF